MRGAELVVGLAGTGCDVLRPTAEIIKSCSAVLERSPGNVDALAIRANAHRLQSNPVAALNDFNAVLAIDPNHIFSLGRRVSLASAMPTPIEAAIKADVDRIFAVTPVLASHYEARGLARWGQRNFPAALEELSAGLRAEPNSVALLIARAGVYSNMADFAAALADSENAVAAAPAYASAHGVLARSLLDSRKHAEAIRAYDKAIALDSMRPAFFVDRARSHLGLRNFEQAESDLDKALDMNPSLLTGYYYRGQVQFARGEWDRALSDYNTAIALNPRFAGVYVKRGEVFTARGHHARALAEYNKAIEIDPKHPEAHYRRGNALLAAADLAGAIAAFDDAIKLGPNIAIPYGARANAKLRLQDFASAAADATKAIELSPSSYSFHLSRGLAKFKLGQTQAAIADYTKAYELAPRLGEILLRRAEAYEAIGDSVNAAGDRALAQGLTTMSKAAPGTPAAGRPAASVDIALEAARLQIERGELDLAIAEIDKVLVVQPNARAYQLRGHAYFRKDDNARALADYTLAIQLDGKFTPAFTGRCRVQLQLRYADKAIEDCTRAIELGPPTALVYTTRGWARRGLNQWDLALADFDTAIELDPKYVNALTGRGLVHYYARRLPEATAEFRKVLELQPGNRTALVALRMLTRGTAPASDASAASMQVRVVRLADTKCGSQCAEWIDASGQIDADTPERFRMVLASIGDRKLPVFVDSVGGSVQAAMEVGRMIRARNLDVYVTRTEFVACPGDSVTCSKASGVVFGLPRGKLASCSSACTDILAAGTVRGVGPSALVGVHQAAYYERSVFGEAPKLSSRAVPEILYTKRKDYLVEMGIDANLMIRTLATPHSSMYWLSRQELEAARLSNSAKSGEELVTGRESDDWMEPSRQVALIQAPASVPAVPAAAAAPVVYGPPAPVPVPGAAPAKAIAAPKVKPPPPKLNATAKQAPPSGSSDRMCFSAGNGGGGMVRCDHRINR